jgi:arginyl-tRNA synthetase
MNLRDELERRICGALTRAGAPQDAPALIKPSARPEFGDYQANGCMAAAKEMKTNPRELAAAVKEHADLGDIAENVEVAGPGFINITLKTDWLAERLAAALADDRLGVPAPHDPDTVVVDYSSPNIAKDMHVGHLRSTIIGDALARTLEFTGETVVRQNHVGDWGTQFGRVILGLWHLCQCRHHGDYVTGNLEKLQDVAPSDPAAEDLVSEIRDTHQKYWREDSKDEEGDGKKYFQPFLKDFSEGEVKLSFDDLLPFYRFVNLVETVADGTDIRIKTRKMSDGEFEVRKIPYARLSSHVTWMLQQYDDEDRVDDDDRVNKQEYDAWETARELSLEKCEAVYNKLGISLTREDVRGESFYNPMLPAVLDDLDELGLLAESEGARGVFLEEFKNRDNEPAFVIVQKSDGGYLYSTTDLAALRFRSGEGLGAGKVDWVADRILYVTDSRQHEHFQKVFTVARKAGFVPEHVSLEHVGFGMMLGKDGKPFKTRTGGTVKLMDLLEEAVTRARSLVDEKNPDLSEAERGRVAEVVGIGAVKYADLSQNRLSDYVFSWDKMLSLDGNTAPYMQYAYARVKSIFRRGECDESELAEAGIELADPAERALAVKLAQLPETIDAVARECMPSLLCTYLFELAGAYMSFYERCPVLKAETKAGKLSRLALCALTARTIKQGLELLGIDVLEQM